MDDYIRLRNGYYSEIVFKIVIIAVVIWGCYELHEYNNRPEAITARQKEEQTERIKEEIIRIAKANDFHSLEDWIDKLFNKLSDLAIGWDSAIEITDEKVKVYAYYNWHSSNSEMLFCSDGIRWKVGKEGRVEFMPYNNIRTHGSISQLPDQDDVQGALKGLMSWDFQKILRGE